MPIFHARTRCYDHLTPLMAESAEQAAALYASYRWHFEDLDDPHKAQRKKYDDGASIIILGADGQWDEYEIEITHPAAQPHFQPIRIDGEAGYWDQHPPSR